MRDGSATLHAEQSSGPFNPEIILPTQYFRASTAHTGERRLLVAVLEDAIGCFQKNACKSNRRGRRLFAEVERWFMSADRQYVYAFENVCDFLQLDANAIRLRLRRWAQTVVAEGADRAATNSNGQRQPAKKALAAAAARAGFVPVSSQPYDIGSRTNPLRSIGSRGAANTRCRIPKTYPHDFKKREVS